LSSCSKIIESKILLTSSARQGYSVIDKFAAKASWCKNEDQRIDLATLRRISLKQEKTAKQQNSFMQRQK